MTKPRALYVCPVTQGAIVVAAGLIAEDTEYEIAKVLLLQGVANSGRPTASEWSEAIRPEKGIRSFFERRGILVQTKKAHPYQDVAWKDVVVSSLDSKFLDGIDLILFNAQAGTKQMSIGAWDGLFEVASPKVGKVRKLSRCFVRPGFFQLDGKDKRLTELSISDYLLLYGFEEIKRSLRQKREQWIQGHQAELESIFTRQVNDPLAAIGYIKNLYVKDRGLRALWPQKQFLEGTWLEGVLYSQALSFFEDDKVASSLSISDWASGGSNANEYELDLIILSLGTLHLIECKATNVTQEDIHKQGVLRDRLQGRSGVNAILAGAPPAAVSPLYAKAAQKQIQLVKADKLKITLLLKEIQSS